jgi:hypothetical protein
MLRRREPPLKKKGIPPWAGDVISIALRSNTAVRC